MAGLRAWLRRTPQPHHLRVRTEDDELRDVQLTEDVRNRWRSAEEAVLAMRATSVECIDKSGAVLRAMVLEVEGGEAERESRSDDDRRRAEERVRSRERVELAAVLDSYGRQINAAFNQGAQAAAVSQDNLVHLVDTLSNNLATSITNLHNIAANFAQQLMQMGAGQEEDRNGLNERLLGTVLGAAVGKATEEQKGRKA